MGCVGGDNVNSITPGPRKINGEGEVPSLTQSKQCGLLGGVEPLGQSGVNLPSVFHAQPEVTPRDSHFWTSTASCRVPLQTFAFMKNHSKSLALKALQVFIGYLLYAKACAKDQGTH